MKPIKAKTKRLTVKNSFKITKYETTDVFDDDGDVEDTSEEIVGKPSYSTSINEALEKIKTSFIPVEKDHLEYSYAVILSGETDCNGTRETLSIEGPELLILKLKLALRKKYFPDDVEEIRDLRREILLSSDSSLTLAVSNDFSLSDSQSQTFQGRSLKAV